MAKIGGATADRALYATTSQAHPPSVPLLVAVSSLCGVLAPLNSTMIAVALPAIRSEFDLSHATVGWLISAYLIAMAVGQPLGGRLGDQVGRIPVLRGGLIAFVVCSFGAALAPNFALLVVFRVAQAVAGAVLMPNGMAMLRTLADPEQLGRLTGFNGAVLSAAAAAGPLIGAAALALGSWRLVFLVSLPLVALALFLVQRIEAPKPEAVERTPIDWLGMSLFVALLGGATLQLASLRDDDAGVVSALRWGALAMVAAAFAWQQRRTLSPAAEWQLFRIRSFAAATSYVLLTNLTMYTTLLMIPFFIRDVQDRSTQLAGLLLGAMSILVTITAPLGGRLSDAWGRRPLALAGSVVALAGSVALFAGLDADVSAVYIAGSLALLGVGLGIGTGPATTAAVESAPREQAGAAAGTNSMMRYAGSIFGAGVLAGVLTDSGAGTADVDTFRLLALAVACTAALAVAAALFIHRFSPSLAPTRVPGDIEPSRA